ncbi:MAG: DNA cytosine methyltransferase [Rhizonema sp. NSF051]|nr:DNA cytosine methyltransferase [Rhizonema sp. NSF051]
MMESFSIGSIASGMGMHLWGLKSLGGFPAWAIECDPQIGEVYTENHPDSLMVCDRVENLSPDNLPDIDCLIATPSCKNASLLRGSGLQETNSDLAVGNAIAKFIDAKRPKIFLLENVWQYRKFDSFRVIQTALQNNEYGFAYYKINCSRLGVAQSRVRLYCIGIRFCQPPNEPNLPECSQVSWHDALQDILGTLPETILAPWQQKKFPELPHTCLLKRVGGGRKSDRPYLPGEPSFTIRALGRGCDRHWRQGDIKVGDKIHILTPRAALRLFGDAQTSDRIWLPTRNALAMECVGNGASWVVFQWLAQAAMNIVD